MDNEKRIEILQELRNDINDTCHNSDMTTQVDVLDYVIKNLKRPGKFSMQNVKNSDETIWITDSTFKSVFAYWLYYMCPGHPRKFETIMTKIIAVVDKQFTIGTLNTVRMISMACKDVESWIKDIINNIPEILELNLTTNEYNNGVTLETRENQDVVVLTSRYSVIPQGEDFVDISALIGNITYSICKESLDY